MPVEAPLGTAARNRPGERRGEERRSHCQRSGGGHPFPLPPPARPTAHPWPCASQPPPWGSPESRGSRARGSSGWTWLGGGDACQGGGRGCSPPPRAEPQALRWPWRSWQGRPKWKAPRKGGARECLGVRATGGEGRLLQEWPSALPKDGGLLLFKSSGRREGALMKKPG